MCDFREPILSKSLYHLSKALPGVQVCNISPSLYDEYKSIPQKYIYILKKLFRLKPATHIAKWGVPLNSEVGKMFGNPFSIVTAISQDMVSVFQCFWHAISIKKKLNFNFNFI